MYNPYLVEGPVYAQPTPEPLSELGKGLRRGVRGFSPSIDRTQAAVQQVLGYDQAAEANLAEAQQAEAKLQTPELAARVQNFTDAKTAGDYWDWAQSSIGENVPLFGAMAGTALTGGALGALAAGARGAAALGKVAGMAPYFIQTTGENSQNTMDDPTAQGTPREKAAWALAGGAGQTALGTLPFEHVAGALMKPASSMLARTGKAALTGMLSEGSTEMGEEAVSKLAHQQVSPNNPAAQLNTKQAWLDYINAAAPGALLGGVMGGGSAIVSHPFLAKAAQRDPDGPQGFLSKHGHLLDEESKVALQDLPAQKPSGRLEAKMWEIEDRDNLDIFYQDMVGMPRREHDAQRQERLATLDNLGKQFFLNGELNPQDPAAVELMKNPGWEDILDSYVRGKEEDWLRESKQQSLEEAALAEFEPEERQRLELIRSLGEDPRYRNAYNALLTPENKELLNRYEGIFGQVSRPAREEEVAYHPENITREPLIQDQEDVKDSDLAFPPGFTEQSTSSDYRLGKQEMPWLSQRVREEGLPEEEKPKIREDIRRRWESQAVADLPLEGQISYKEQSAPTSAFTSKWYRIEKAGPLTPEQEAQKEAEKAVAEEQTQANLDAWREKRRALDDAWGQKLNTIELRPVPLLQMIEEENDLDSRRPEDAQKIAKIVERDYLSRAKGNVKERYGNDPLGYARDFEVLNKPKHPNIISGRDELTPTRDELVPKPAPRERAAIAEKEAALLTAQKKVGTAEEADPLRYFKPEEIGKVYNYRMLQGRGDSAATEAYYKEHKDIIDRADTAIKISTDLSDEAYALREDIKNLKRKGAPVITDRPNPKGTNTEFLRKRIPVLQYNTQSKTWVKKSIDPMALVIQEMTHKKNFEASPEKFLDEVANAFESGLAGILGNEALGVKLDAGPHLDPETIIYTRRNGGIQIRWKDLQKTGFDRMQSIMDGLDQKAKPETVEALKRDMRGTLEGAEYVAQLDSRGESDPEKLAEIEQRRYQDVRAIQAKIAKEKWASEQDRDQVQEIGKDSEDMKNERTPIPPDQSNKWLDDMPREDAGLVPDKRPALSAKTPELWAPSKPVREVKLQSGKILKMPTGYEVSDRGDKRFSQFGAKLKDGRNIDTAYKQARAKLRTELFQQAQKAEAERVTRLQEAARKKGQDPSLIKPEEIEMREPEPREVYPLYKALWQQWAVENPSLIEDLRKKAAGRPLTDYSLRKGAISPARALAEIMDESAPRGTTRLPSEAAPTKKEAPTLSVVQMSSPSYPQRTEHNAKRGDVTASLAIDQTQRGETGDKLVAWEKDQKLEDFADSVTAKLQERNGTTLNVTGNDIDVWKAKGVDQTKLNEDMLRVLSRVKENHPTLERVVTGGQSGSDIAAAIAARALGISVEVNMPRGFIQRVGGKTVNRSQASVENYIEIEAKKLTTEAPEAMANPPKQPLGDFGVYGEGPNTFGPPAMPKPSANLRPEEASRGVGETSTSDLKKAAGIPNGPPVQVVRTEARPLSPTTSRVLPTDQFNLIRERAAQTRLDPETVTAQRLDTPPAQRVIQAEPPVAEYQPMLDDYQKARAAQASIRNEVLPSLNRTPKERLATNTKLFLARQAAESLRKKFVETYGENPEALSALTLAENPPNVKPNTKASPTEGMPRPDPRAESGPLRLSLKTQPTPDPVKGQYYDERMSNGLRTEEISPQQAPIQAPTAVETQPKAQPAQAQPKAQPAQAQPGPTRLERLRNTYVTLKEGKHSTDTELDNLEEANVEIVSLFKEYSKDESLTPELRKEAASIHEELTDGTNRTYAENVNLSKVSAFGKKLLQPAQPAQAKTVSKQDRIYRSDVKSNPNTLYVFGDNDARKGYGGQAATMRGERNAVGIRTKALPETGENAYWSDKTYEENIRKIDEDMAPLFAHTGPVVIPSDGIGTGRAQLARRAPKTFEYLQSKLAELEGKPAQPAQAKTPAQSASRAAQAQAQAQPAQPNQRLDALRASYAALKKADVPAERTKMQNILREYANDPAASPEIRETAGRIFRTSIVSKNQIPIEQVAAFGNMVINSAQPNELVTKLSKAEQALPAEQMRNEERLATSIMSKLGLNSKIAVVNVAMMQAKIQEQGMPARKINAFGKSWYNPDGTFMIYINPTMSTAARIEVLGHELGHAVFSESYSTASPATQRAINGAYQKWRAEHGKGTIRDIFASKKTLNRSNDPLSERIPAWQTLDDLSEEGREYVLSFEEWFADQTSRWLVTDAKPMNEVQRFFKHMADMIRDLLKNLQGKANIPDAEVAKFLNEMLAPAQIKEQTLPGAKPSAPSAQETKVQAEHQKFADAIMKNLGLRRRVVIETRGIGKPNARGSMWMEGNEAHIYINPDLKGATGVEVLGHELGHVVFMDSFLNASAKIKNEVMREFEKWLSTFSDTSKLSDIYASKKSANLMNEAWNSRNDTKLGELSEAEQNYVRNFEEWFADNVSRWMVSDAKPVTLVEQFFKDVADVIRDLFNMVFKNIPNTSVAKFMDSLYQGQGQEINPTKNQIFGTLWINSVSSEEKAVLNTAFRSGPVQSQLRKFYPDVDIRDPDMAVSLGVEKWLTGDLKLGPQADTVLKKGFVAVNKALGNIDPMTQAESILKSLLNSTHQNYQHVDRLSNTTLQRAYGRMEKASRSIVETLSKMALSGNSQIKMMGNAYADVIAEKIFTETNEEGVAEGLLSGRTRQIGYFENKLHQIFDGEDDFLGSHVIDILTKKTDINAASDVEKRTAVGIYRLLEEMHKYAKKEVKKIGHQGKQIEVEIGGKKVTVNDYFPRVLDTEYLQSHNDEFVKMLLQPKYASEVADEEAAKRIYRAYMRNYGAQVEGEEDQELRDNDPLGYLAKRKLDWIDDKDLAPFLSTNLGEAVFSYISSTVNQVELKRVFPGNSFKDLLDKAEATGLTKYQRERITTYMRGIQGFLGDDINPTFNTIQGWIITLQSWAILGTSTFSSLADPMGIAVRGDFKVAWTGLKAGMNELVSSMKGDKTELRHLAEVLGMIERSATLEALNYQYGSYAVKGAAKTWNDRLFRWNMTQSFTRGTRLMALAAAREFIVKHSKGTEKHSARFLDQLSLRKEDVLIEKGQLKILSDLERETASKAELERDDRVRVALNRFVDDAILRPNAAMRPIYANDPIYALFFYLKSFTYAFNERIIKRASREAVEGNYMPLLAMASYAPIMFAAMALRSAMRGIDDDKNLNWSEAIQRSGIFGFGQWFLDAEKDRSFGSIPGVSLLDPTSRMALDTVKALWSEGTTDDKKMFIRALPLQSEWKHWID